MRSNEASRVRVAIVREILVDDRQENTMQEQRFGLCLGATGVYEWGKHRGAPVGWFTFGLLMVVEATTRRQWGRAPRLWLAHHGQKLNI